MKNEAIAIIGMACRFPGAANPQSFWTLLKKGDSPLREIPRDRWDAEFFYNRVEKWTGEKYVRHGYFLDDIDQFDASFFRISPKEAIHLDPQHRLLLEVTWEAFANANMHTDALLNSDTGVYVGLMNHDYGNLIYRSSAPEEMNFLSGLGNSSHCAAGRIAYTFGLRGPCMTIDTACSSSLVALHQACQALRQDDCRLAVAGAVNLILDPYLMINMYNGKVLSGDGRCKTFDASADGYGRGEGSGVVILKRLSTAVADQDPILAVIRSTAVNQNGPGHGITVPNGEAQRMLLQKAITAAQLQPADINYLEAHGSATPLGDLVEMNSIAAVLSKREKTNPLIISSVKTYIGHLEAASGMAGLIKIVLSLQNQHIPKHLHFVKLNPNVDLSAMPAIIPTQLTPWLRNEKPRIAGVSSFGISGTNAHAIIEESHQEVNQYSVSPPFKRKRYWNNKLDNILHQDETHITGSSLGRVSSPHLHDIRYRIDLNKADHIYLDDHHIFNTTLFPLAGFIDMLLTASHRVASCVRKGDISYLHVLNDVVIENPLDLSLSPSVTLQLAIKQLNNVYTISINQTDETNLNRYVKAELSLIKNEDGKVQVNLDQIKRLYNKIINVEEGYAQLDGLGLKYGPRMRAVDRLGCNVGAAFARLTLPKELSKQSYHCHPVLLDGAFQAAAMAIYREQSAQGEPQFYLPMSVRQIKWYRSLSDTIYAYIRYPELSSTLDIIEVDVELYDEMGASVVDIKGFCLKRSDRLTLQHAVMGGMTKHFYVENWHPLPAPTHSLSATETWLMIGSSSQLSLDLLRSLQQLNVFAALMKSVDEYQDINKLTGIIFLAENESQQSCHELFTLLKHLQQKHPNPIPKIIVITQGARVVTEEDAINPHQAAIWGMMQCARHEFSETQLKCVDISVQQIDMNLVINEIRQEDSELHIALRQGKRYVLRLERLIPLQTPYPFRGTYLITGGLGGLGLVIAEELVRHGVKHIVLIGRSGPAHTAKQKIAAFCSQGIHVAVCQADVGQAHDMKAIIHMIRDPINQFAPLRGVVHAAGILSDGLIRHQTWTAYEAVWRPKAIGAWNLHELTLEDQLDHFILFSSIASVIGSAGQSNYGAANAFLDALAYFRRQMHLPALSMNWGPWSQVGMASTRTKYHAENGVQPLTPAKGAQLFSLACQLKELAQITITELNADRLLATMPSQLHAYFNALTKNVKEETEVLTTKQELNIKEVIKSSLMSVLGFSADDLISDDDNFFELGMDSLFALQLHERLTRVLKNQIEISTVMIFQYPTINSLSRILGKTGGSLQNAETAVRV